MPLNIDVHSTRQLIDTRGEKMPLRKFLEDVRNGILIDYDGFAREVVTNDNRVVSNRTFRPSEIEKQNIGRQLVRTENNHGELFIMWYHR